jgi:ABC-type multidrug transport system ATPase subunit
MITKASTQCWDNSTRGLDASTALEYVESLRTLTSMAHVSTLVALYQAGESLYELFDKVVLIHEGQCAYFGPTTEAKAYFESLGFHCPPRCTTAEFLTSVVDRHEREIKPGWEDRFPRSADDFKRAYHGSEVYRRNLADIEQLDAELEQQRRERDAERAKLKKKNYTIPFYKQVLACTRRQFLVMLGDRLSLFGKWGGIIFQGIIVGSCFYNMPTTTIGVFPRGGTKHPLESLQ